MNPLSSRNYRGYLVHLTGGRDKNRKWCAHRPNETWPSFYSPTLKSIREEVDCELNEIEEKLIMEERLQIVYILSSGALGMPRVGEVNGDLLVKSIKDSEFYSALKSSVGC